MLVPSIAYAACFVLAHSHAISLVALWVATAIELLFAVLVLDLRRPPSRGAGVP